MTLVEIAESLRRMFPEAVAVQFFVNYEEFSTEVTHKTPIKGQSWRRLDGKYIKEEEVGNIGE